MAGGALAQLRRWPAAVLPGSAPDRIPSRRGCRPSPPARGGEVPRPARADALRASTRAADRGPDVRPYFSRSGLWSGRCRARWRPAGRAGRGRRPRCCAAGEGASAPRTGCRTPSTRRCVVGSLARRAPGAVRRSTSPCDSGDDARGALTIPVSRRPDPAGGLRMISSQVLIGPPGRLVLDRGTLTEVDNDRLQARVGARPVLARV